MGILDVDAMLASMHPDQFDEWCAKDAIEPIGQAGVTALLSVIGAMVGSYGENQINPEDVRKSCVVDGTNWRPWEAPVFESSAEQIKAQAASVIRGV